MPRLSPLQAPYSEEVAATFAKLMPPGMAPLRLFRTLAHNPRVLGRIRRGGLLDPGSISTRLRELVILRTCSLCSSDYEWGVHAALFATSAQLSGEALASVCAPALGSYDWEPRERLAMKMCDELHETATIGDELWEELAAHFEDAQLIELVTLAGLYHAISFIANATGVEPEEWATRPPR